MAIELTKELLTTEAQTIAKDLVSKQKGMTRNQLRKFYDDFLILKSRADLVDDDKEFQKSILPLICFSKSKMAYSCGNGIIDKVFMNKISSYIDKIENKSDFENFINFYQALIGYYTYEDDVAKNERTATSARNTCVPNNKYGQPQFSRKNEISRR